MLKVPVTQRDIDYSRREKKIKTEKSFGRLQNIPTFAPANVFFLIHKHANNLINIKMAKKAAYEEWLRIQRMNTVRLKKGAHANFMQSVYDRLKQESFITKKAKPFFLKFESAVSAENELITLGRASIYTKFVAEGDHRRDVLYMSYKKMLPTFRTFSKANIVAAGDRLERQLKDLNIHPKGQLDDETGKFVRFVDELQGKYADDVKLLNLTDLVSEMKAANDELMEATTNRRMEKADIEPAAVNTARRITDAAYEDIILLINSFIMLDGESTYLELVNYLNTLITDYKRNAIGQKAPNLSTGGSDTGSGNDDDDDVPQG
jgi:hypothetical protein